MSVERINNEALREAVRQYGGSIRGMARLLDMNDKALRRMLGMDLHHTSHKCPHCHHRIYKNSRHRQNSIRTELAARVADVIGADPVDVGL